MRLKELHSPLCIWKNFQFSQFSSLIFSTILIFVLFINLPYSSSSKNVNKKVGLQQDSSKVNIKDGVTPDTKVLAGVDIVSFGEDCSPEGPFCDVEQHLTCDPVEETCICDENAGYVHIDNVPGHHQYQMLLQNEQSGKKMTGEDVCISIKEVERRTEALLSLTTKLETDTGREFEMAERSDLQNLPMNDNDEQKDERAGASEMETRDNGNSIYEEAMKTFDDSGLDFDKERLKQFKLNRTPLHVYSVNDLILAEILKYGNEAFDLKELKEYIQSLISSHLNLKWNEHKLSKSICHTIYDIDRDGVFTHQEYVIAILSKQIRDLVAPKVFLDLIGPLMEEKCISLQDLQTLDHDPETLEVDFATLDLNGDGCFSFDEFEKLRKDICQVGWFYDFLVLIGLEVGLELLDPSPEEMYIRRILQNERLSINWQSIDTDKDGLLSFEELDADLRATGLGLEFNEFDSEALMKHLDTNYDGKVSLQEVKSQISLPHVTEEYQFEWLESLYELYETDEPDVKEYVQLFLESAGEYNSQNSFEKQKTDRLFQIFDRNGNGEIDEVELRLFMEIQKKYVVDNMLSMTIAAMDLNSDGKLTIFEYEEFFTNASLGFRVYFKNLLAEEVENEEMDEGEDSEDSGNASTAELSKKAAATNETLIIRKFFHRLDRNSDGFLSKEDFHYHLISYPGKKTDSELRVEFTALDIDGDGMITSKDSLDVTEPMTFETFKERLEVYEEIVDSKDVTTYLSFMDDDGDSIVQFEEFAANKMILFSPDDEHELLAWIEDYFGESVVQMDPDGEKAFREFDLNCDGVISETEFKSKLEELQSQTSLLSIMSKMNSDSRLYFNSLDLSKDGKVSYNEFEFLMLRNNRADEK